LEHKRGAKEKTGTGVEEGGIKRCGGPRDIGEKKGGVKKR